MSQREVDVRQNAVIDILLIVVFFSLLICGKVSADTGWQSGRDFQGAVEFGGTITPYDFSLWGVHVLAGKSFACGLFVDGMAGYRELSEDYSIQRELSDLSGRVKSHILTSGIRGRWKIHTAPSI